MNDRYEPEIGQMCFGNPWGEFECPDYIVALIEFLASEVCISEWNRTQDEQAFDKPTNNSGSRWANDTFSLRAYYWGDDEAEQAKPNFACGDFGVRWYKHARRGTTMNREVTPAEAVAFFERCLASIDMHYDDPCESAPPPPPDGGRPT
jgi:hypothetical protein